MNLSKFNIELNADLAWRLFLLFVASVAIISASESVMAAADPNNGGGGDADTDPLGNALCRIVETLTGNFAKAIATIAIFTVGVSLFMGKMNWGMALAIAAGVAIIFAAPQMVGWLGGEGVNGECSTN